MNPWPAMLLLLALVPVATTLRRRPRAARPRPGNRFRRMATGALWRFGLSVPVLLALAGRLPALATMPRDFAPLADALGLGGGGDPGLIVVLTIGALIGMSVSTAVVAWRAWRGRAARHWFGDFAHLEAASHADRGWATLLGIVAGVTEEGYFRLLLPLLTAMAFPGWGAAAGFLGSTMLFGAAHRYQGWRGVAATTVAGAAMATLYLASGSLLLAMAYHAMIDIGSMVLRPWVRQAVTRRRLRRGRRYGSGDGSGGTHADRESDRNERAGTRGHGTGG